MTTLPLVAAALLALLAGQPAPSAPAKPAPSQPTQPEAPKKVDAPKKVEAPKIDADKAASQPSPRTDKGWVDRNESFNARAKQGHEKGDIGMLFIGDSITEGWEGAGKDVWAQFYAKRHAVNLGIGGDKTQHVLFRMEHGNLDGLAKPVTGAAPKLAVIMIGTNNSGDTAPEGTAAGVLKIVESVRAKVPGIKVLLLGVFPREEKPGAAREKNTKVNAIIMKAADNKEVFYMDIGSSFTNADGTLSKDIMPDFLHLSPKGYQKWAEAIEPKVTELLK